MSNYRRLPLWYKDAIIYEINIKGFYDSNRDGIGDFAGLEEKLDYIEDLGVTAIWVLPFYPSPLRDDGYDIADYYNIREAYGNIDDFKRFLDAAHDRNLQVITELVINHTSDQHPWFQRARRAPIGSPERDYYVWSDTDQKYQDVRIIFTDTETSNWTWDPVAGQYYWHRFFHHQPDLNYDNPLVQEEIFKILDYWMEMGIDGFRLDAIPYLFEREGTNGENLPETHAFLKKLRKHVDERYENVLFLAEANMWPEDSASYFGDGDECHMNYHFPIMPRLYMSVKMEERHPITDIFEQTPEIPENCQWATFLRNHDELTLEMVTDEERDFMYKVYAEDKTARINLGIRRRLAPLMDNDREKIELLNILLLSLPGTPVLYYGDEIGMGDNYYLGDRDGVRTPMQWNNNVNAGFSEANPHSLYLPVIQDTEFSYQWVNVKRQEENPNSLLNWTRKILSKRREYKVFGRGSLTWLYPENGCVLAFIREYEDEKVLVVVNLSRHAQSVSLDLSPYQGMKLREVFGRTHFNDITQGPYQITLAGHGYYWMQLESTETTSRDVRRFDRTYMNLQHPHDLFSKPNLRLLQKEILPIYLRSVNWTGAKAERLERTEVVYHRMYQYQEQHYGWLLVKLYYKEDQPEYIQLPLALHPFQAEADYHSSEAVLCKLQMSTKTATTEAQMVAYVLLDALYDESYRAGLLEGWGDLDKASRFAFEAREALLAAKGQRVHIEHSGTEYMLLGTSEISIKYYRRIDTQRVPDLEVKEILNSQGNPLAPRLLGTLHFSPQKNWSSTLAIFEERAQTVGFLWNQIYNQFQRFAEDLLAAKRSGREDFQASIDPATISLCDPMVYAKMPEAIQQIMGAASVTKLADFGRVVASYHSLVATVKNPSFSVEALSLHYQRSLYASHKGQIRSTLTLLRKKIPLLNDAAQLLGEEILARETEMQQQLKRIFRHKIEADKVRIHGDFTLEQVHVTQEGFLIKNFDGDPEQAFSQRRLRRSPAKDIANIFRSIHYAASLVAEEHAALSENLTDYLRPWLEATYRCLAAEFLTAYRKAAAGSRLLPADEEDLNVLLDTFMIEKALQEIRYDLNYRPNQVVASMSGLLALLNQDKESTGEED